VKAKASNDVVLLRRPAVKTAETLLRMTTVQVDEKAQKQQQMLERGTQMLRESLRSLEESRETGAYIAVELQRHDEILSRVDKSADEVDVELNR
jgi:hypothetical protein